jgi:flagellar M-ring protein FliF
MEALNPVLQPLLRVWRGLSRVQQIGLGIVGVALLGVLLFVSTIGHGSDSAVAFSGLSTDDEAVIVQKLKDAKIPYTLGEGGTIRVPAAQVHDAQLATAGLGLNGKPATGSGFELFNQPAFGQTEFTQKVNYQRALEAELERSINQMAGVDSSRVHLVIPEQALFASQQQPTTASIMLKLKPGKHLDSTQARAITNLVSGSVQGLKPQNLTIVDSNGNTLTPDDTADGGASLTSKQLQTELNYESTMEKNLRAMLDNVLGAGKASVRVTALMNWDQVEQTDETYTPNDPTTTPVLTNHIVTENSAGGTSVGGVPGAASNNGATVPTYQGGSGANGPTSKSDTQTTYQLNKSTQKTVRAPGAVTRLSVAVMLDDDPNNPNQALQQSVQDAVNAAAGIDPSRGDVLTVTAVPFNRQDLLMQQAALAEATRQDQLMNYLHLGALAIGPLLMLGLLFLIFRKGRKKQAPPRVVEAVAETPETPEAINLPPLVETVDAGAAAAAASATRFGKPVTQVIVEDPQKVYIREQIQSLGTSNPATLAQLIQTWMDEDRRN